MKAAGLMIGDFVKTNKGDVIKVESISTKRQHRKVGYHSEEDCTKIKYVRQGQIEPIHLTEDILKANFKQSDRDDIFYSHRVEIHFWEEGNVTYKIRSADLADVCIDYYCKYVHELQYALRLCGLTELADNFKIERYGTAEETHDGKD